MVRDIGVLWDVVFVICVIYESMRDMEIKDSKNIYIYIKAEASRRCCHVRKKAYLKN